MERPFSLRFTMAAAIKTLAAAVRSGTGKGAARSVRRGGRVPGVIYGGGEAPEPISLDYNETHKLIYAGHFLTTIFELDIDGRKERVIPRDYQLDVVKDTPTHVDFLRLRAGSKLKVAVPVHFINGETAPGIKRGGTLNVVQHSVDLLAPADNIPDSITIDLAGLDINDSVHISAVALPEGCRPAVRDRDFTVVTIAAPSVLTAEEEGTAQTAEAAAAAAPASAGKTGAPAKGGAPAAAAAKK
jgi:large subunit ribosomal protein L25